MRWKSPEPERHKNNDKKIVTKFLWLPKSWHGQWRWLEEAKLKYRWDSNGGLSRSNFECRGEWVFIGFADDEESK